MFALQALPLLHVGQTAMRVTGLDGRVVSLAACLFVVAAAAIWLPEVTRSPASLLRRRTRRKLGRAALAALVLFAVLPSVLPYDHLLPGSHGDDPADEQMHVTHCHVSPGTCTDAPVTSGPGQFLLADPLILAPAMLAVLLVLAAPILRGVTLRPEIRPPLLSSAA